MNEPSAIYSQNQPSQSPRLDTAQAVPVSGPHEPQPFPADHALAESLRAQREGALITRDAHAAELAAQQEHHNTEIARAERIVAACNAALAEIDSPETAPAPGAAYVVGHAR